MSPRPQPSRTEPSSTALACERGEACVHDAAGHGLGALRLRLALATPSGWVDAVVLTAEADGPIDVVRWDTGDRVRIWHHADAGLAAGEPVALHLRYGVLAAGSVRLNVAV